MQHWAHVIISAFGIVSFGVSCWQMPYNKGNDGLMWHDEDYNSLF